MWCLFHSLVSAVYPYTNTDDLSLFGVFRVNPILPGYVPPTCPSFVIPDEVAYREARHLFIAQADAARFDCGAEVDCLRKVEGKEEPKEGVIIARDGLLFNVAFSDGTNELHTYKELCLKGRF